MPIPAKLISRNINDDLHLDDLLTISSVKSIEIIELSFTYPEEKLIDLSIFKLLERRSRVKAQRRFEYMGPLKI